MIDAAYRAESRRVLATLIRLRSGSNSQRRRCTKPSPRQVEIAERLELEAMRSIPGEGEGIEDDRLRLIFTCCHPLQVG